MGRALVTLLLLFGSVAVAYILYWSWRAASAVDDASTVFRETGSVTETAKRLYGEQITPDADRPSKRQVEIINAPAIPDKRDRALTHNGGQQNAATERWNALARFDNFPKGTTLHEAKGPHEAILLDYSLIMDDGGLGGRTFGIVNKTIDWARTFIQAVDT